MSRPLDCNAAQMWQDNAWAGPCGLRADAAGNLQTDVIAAAGVEQSSWFCPGVPNLHSHAFQRAMAGMAERRGNSDDSFWTWRETMYQVAARFDPDTLRAVATQVYAEMLEAGYTHVCEFHYLHHDPAGRRYADPAAMSLAIIEAAERAGIGLTLLPTLYQRGGFDDRALSARQQRFGHGIDDYCALIERLNGMQHARLRVGIAFHSLRAVAPTALRVVLDAVDQHAPVHIHIAEQQSEVDECIAHYAARPVRWLLDHLPVDQRWALVHATHCDAGELRDLAASGATAVLCPSTEANLGDGLFDLPAYLAHGGRLGIGSDSQISIAPTEELRWLEYGQRLRLQQRNIAAVGAGSVAQALLAKSWDAAAVCGVDLGALHVGARADVLALDPDAPSLVGARQGDVLDRWIFCGQRSAVRDVWVAGEQVVAAGRHRDCEAIAQQFKAALKRLWPA
ncbi:MAG: formimidoylglutamate deiminase [Xanthomonadaceae bacterium]|nr:formimidoylglutamate deiminase [Xanthomonadaceae bacterium]MDP2185359.1 formimidoylglutamate deiminase [Xanthomonadales bacterium]MDZ4117259.1 formimidoylglutamate deiminase [Xanthomonadaceae bacterium]MDZ4376670.1 formimidoylglutamate deiminase [Xanthomonadaceae bacterium]